MSVQRWYCVDLVVKGWRRENVLAASEEEARQKAIAQAKSQERCDPFMRDDDFLHSVYIQPSGVLVVGE